jgi:hypothetical protein
MTVLSREGKKEMENIGREKEKENGCKRGRKSKRLNKGTN